MNTTSIYPQIVKTLHHKGALSRAELAAELGPGYARLNQALRDLETSGLIRLDHPGERIGKDTIVSLRAEENCVIGLDLGGTKLFGAIANLSGNLLHEAEIYGHGKTGEACYMMLVGMIDTLLGEARQRGLRIRGIGVEVPGRVRLETGYVLRAPAVQWEEFPLKERLVSRFGLPVFVDNDLKQSTLGEAWFGAGRGGSNIAYVAIGTGIAAGVVANDELQRGAHLRHGEIGWMVPDRRFLGKRYQGFGPFEVEASGPGVARRARERLAGKRSESELANLTSEDVFKAARLGEGWAKEVVDETIEYLAILIANTIAFYDPDIIVLSGGISRSSDLLIEPIRKLIDGCVLTPPNILVSSLGYQAGVLGAVVNLILNCPEFYTL
jgi:glucokinase